MTTAIGIIPGGGGGGGGGGGIVEVLGVELSSFFSVVAETFILRLEAFSKSCLYLFSNS